MLGHIHWVGNGRLQRSDEVGSLGMSRNKNLNSTDAENRAPDTEHRKAAADEYVPLNVRNARQMRRSLWPSIWMSFASIIILAVALAILSYRMGAQSCH